MMIKNIWIKTYWLFESANSKCPSSSFLESSITLPKFDTFHIALINKKLISMFGYAITYNSKSCYLLCTKQEKSIPKHLLNFIYNLTVAKLKLHMFMDYKCGVRDLYGDSIIAVEKFY